MNRQQQKQVKNIVFNNLDSIYESCRIVCKQYDTTNISLAVFEKCIEISRPKDLNTTPEFIKFMEAYDTTMQRLITICQNKATVMDKKSVPLKFVKEGLDQIKKSFKEGLNA